MEDTPTTANAAVLDQVPVRLRRIRTRRKMTLTEVAGANGIAKTEIVSIFGRPGERMTLRATAAGTPAQSRLRRTSGTLDVALEILMTGSLSCRRRE